MIHPAADVSVKTDGEMDRCTDAPMRRCTDACILFQRGFTTDDWLGRRLTTKTKWGKDEREHLICDG